VYAAYFAIEARDQCATDRTTMRRLWNTFLKGLAAVLPVALTIYVVFWMAKTAESVLGGPVQALLPKDRYWPGLGLLVAFLLILIVGLLVDASRTSAAFCRPAAKVGIPSASCSGAWAARS
jgi:hypothetical protein